MREATRSVRKAQAAAEKQKHELGDRVLVGCEVERKLSVVREIFLALRHVAADVVNREAALQERVAALRNSNAAPETLVAVTDTRDTQRMAEQAEREARAAYNDLMLFIRGGNQSALHDQLGYSEEIAVGREKCVDDIQDEQALLRDAAMRGQYSFRKFEDWKASVESLWSKVKERRQHSAAALPRVEGCQVRRAGVPDQRDCRQVGPSAREGGGRADGRDQVAGCRGECCPCR
ncbi:hypothetical protein ERJ75_000619500 [Trypanosoma vivax]|nr:hypothetical protein ERJ75_000619500 [Trypanosoma vivax]